MKALTGHESLFSSDAYLIPTLEDDPLLRAYMITSLSFIVADLVRGMQNREVTTGQIQSKRMSSSHSKDPQISMAQSERSQLLRRNSRRPKKIS